MPKLKKSNSGPGKDGFKSLGEYEYAVGGHDTSFLYIISFSAFLLWISISILILVFISHF